MATATEPDWDRWKLLASPMFATLAPLIERLPEDHFPTLAELNRLCEEREVVSGGGEPLEFVPQEAKTGEPYEKRVFAYGKVLTRNRNWHDLFNALAWIAFPRTKAALNARHAAQIPREGGRRGPLRDLLTIFDEGGAIVAFADPGLVERIVAGCRGNGVLTRGRREFARKQGNVGEVWTVLGFAGSFYGYEGSTC